MATAPSADPHAALVWVEAHANASGLRCLDCRAVAAQTIAVASHPEQAARFATLRADDGRALARLRPDDAVALPCALRMPVPSAETRDGALFSARALEDKWDVFLFSGWLYFRRSWSGQLIYRAALHTEGHAAHVNTIEAPGDAASEDPEYCVREVDFLIKALLYHLAVPHPISSLMPANEREIAEFSFQRHGRRGLWATYGDTLAYDPWRAKR